MLQIAAAVALVLIVGVVALFPLQTVSLLTRRRGYSVEAGVAYGSLPRQRLDIFRPDGLDADAPVIVFFHGGGWRAGDKSWYRFVGDAFASAGAIVVIPNYRLHPEVAFPDFVRDGAAAVAWVQRRVATGDSNRRRLFVAGHSAGAHIAALLNLDPHYLADAGVPRSAIAGAIGLAGPYDFLPLKEKYRPVFPEPLLAASQPVAHVDGNAAPMLLLTGDADRTVEPGNTMRLSDAIREKGGTVTVKTYAGVGHLAPLIALARTLPWRKPPIRGEILAFIAGVRNR